MTTARLSPHRETTNVDSDWDVVVIGAGPAGSFAAHQLAVAGHRVLLIERKPFPRPKICGGCLNRRALDVLEGANLDRLETVRSAPVVDRFVGHWRGQTISIATPPGRVVLRSEFDAELAAAAQAEGATFITGATATILPEENASPTGNAGGADHRSIDVHLEDGERMTVRARVVLAADGLTHSSLNLLPEFRSTVAGQNRIGLGAVVDDSSASYPAGRIFMCGCKIGYVGIVRLDDTRLNIAAAIDPEALQAHASPAEVIAQVIAAAGAPAIDSTREVHWTGTPRLTHRIICAASQRVFVLGDALGYVEPFTGEGMSWALADGGAVVPIVGRALRTKDSGPEFAWSTAMRRRLDHQQRWCRRLAWLLRHPAAVSAVVQLVRWAPGITRPIVQALNRRSSFERSWSVEYVYRRDRNRPTAARDDTR